MGSTRTQPSTSAKNAAPRWRRVLRRVGIGAGAGLLLLIVVFFLFPVWISNEQGRAYVVQRINRRLAAANPSVPAARVQVDDWSLGWFHGTELKNVRVLLPDGTVLLSSPRVKTGLTLWDIFRGNYDLHNMTIEDLHVASGRLADGRSSWSLLADAAAGILPTLRGSVQVTGGDWVISSPRTGENVHYREVTSTVTIASPEATFHLQLSATGTAEIPTGGVDGGGGGGTSARPADLSINATLPPIKMLAAGGEVGGVSPWALIEDVEFSATNTPAALICESLGIDAAWADSLGQTLETVHFSNHAPAPQEASRPALMVRGTGPTAAGSEDTVINLRLLLHAPGAHEPRGLVVLDAGGGGVSGEGYQAEASVRMSAKVAAALARIHPIFNDVQPTPGGGNVRVTVSSLDLPVDGDFSDARADARLTFPEVMLMTGRGGVLDQLETLLERGPLQRTPRKIGGSVGRLHLVWEDGLFSYENFVVGLDGTRVNFSGTVQAGGAQGVNLLAILPGVGGGGLGSGTLQVVVDGTVDRPAVRRAQ